jgi:DNA uptake protein ComE-like DNA-binding protein
LGIAAGVWLVGQLRGTRSVRRLLAIDLNKCSREELLAVPGIDDAMAERIIDNRPYRHRLDLVARMVIPSGTYQSIRDRVDVMGNAAENPVNVAS